MEAKVFAKYMLASKAEGCHITPHKDTTHRAGVYIFLKEKDWHDNSNFDWSI